MIYGHVTDLQARVPVALHVPGDGEATVEFVVDTGFAGALTLPGDAVSDLGLRWQESIPVILADGSSVAAHVYAATVAWTAGPVEVAVIALDGRPLLGTALLSGHELVIRFDEGGVVTVDAIW